MDPRRADPLHFAVTALFFAFIVPFLLYSLTAARVGDLPYRASQVLYAGGLAIIALMLSRKYGLSLSGVAKFLALFLLLNMAGNLLTGAFQDRPESKAFTLIQTTLLFLTILLSLDVIARRYTFEEFCNAAAPLAILLIVISAIHVQFFATRVWGRAMFFDLHPNLGGEVIFGAIAIVALHKNVYFRWVCYALGFYTLVQLQSRACQIGAVLVILGCETPRTRKGLAVGSVGGLAAIAVGSVALLINPNIAQGFFDFVSNDLLLANDKFRGEGTGFVGRADTWVMAYEKMVQRPILGTGLNQSGFTIAGTAIHNGYLKNLAEFGVPGMFVNVLVIWGIFAALTKDWRRGVIVGACAVLFFFNARSISLNIFPLILWIAILPWRNLMPAPRTTAPVTIPPDTRYGLDMPKAW